MSTFTKLAYHVIFSTKYRQPLIKDAFQTRLYEYIGGIIRYQKGNLVEVGGIEDHIHLLFNIHPTKPVSDSIREIKANSSKWSRELPKNEFPNVANRFEWQKGYAAFTVSYSQIASVRSYIQNQQEHHKTRTFKDEYIKWLELHDIVYDPKYLFEDEYHG